MLDMDMGAMESLDTAIRMELVRPEEVEYAKHFIPDSIADEPPEPEKGASEAVVERFKQDAEKRYKDAAALLVRFRDDYYSALEEAEKVHGSISIDPSNKLWMLVSAVKVHEAAVKRSRRNDNRFVDRRDYGMANHLMEGLIARSLSYPHVNSLWTMRSAVKFNGNSEAKEFHGGKEFVAYEPVGFKFTDAIVQAVLQLEDWGTEGIVAVVRSSRQNRDLTGQVIYSPDYDTIRAFVLGR